MQKKTKDLFIRLKALRPSIYSISEHYGTDWKTDRIVNIFYLEYHNKHFSFKTEIELCDEIKRLIRSTESDLGFRFPETTKKLKLE